MNSVTKSWHLAEIYTRDGTEIRFIWIRNLADYVTEGHDKEVAKCLIRARLNGSEGPFEIITLEEAAGPIALDDGKYRVYIIDAD